ncbi:MAG: serine/threonine-protein kinase, partial [Terriglobales bacterium]
MQNENREARHEFSPDSPELVEPSQPALHPETLLFGRYKILDCIGSGGMGTVYRATDLVLQRTVALKLLSRSDDPSALLAFQREARAVSNLKHQNIVHIDDFIAAADGAPYMVMEYIEGVSLATLIEECGALPVTKAVPLLLQICDALEHAHEAGVVHRDLKPSNVLLTVASGYD